ncbi:MAG: JAB domain-containing protein, partial [Tissierellia bacterium]|nr:JAB domain-containing protein [Tissierellia bacterium]
TGIFLFHNHPSGNLRPSPQDTNITKKLREAGRWMDIFVLDHIIVTEDNYFSFADEGII